MQQSGRGGAGLVGAARACIAEQGLPDVVIANAGISVGVDTAEFDGVFDPGLPATLQVNAFNAILELGGFV